MRPRRTFDLAELIPAVLGGDRGALGRAITLVESRHPEHRRLAQRMLLELPTAEDAIRVGVTGVPGVGKSTFIESFGLNLIAAGHRVAVLAVDPSSSRTGGSILADKTRMQDLSRDPRAFVRPSPSSGTLGGVTRATRETMSVVEAAGFDVVLVETVGVGQSETAVADMVDFFLVLMLFGAGDEFQGIKKGVLELADLLAVNKADGDDARKAQEAAARYRSALSMLAPKSPTWRPPVLTCSGQHNIGLGEIWNRILEHRERLRGTGEFDRNRADQRRRWMWSIVQDTLLQALDEQPAVTTVRDRVEATLDSGETTPALGAQAILDAFGWPSGA